jgi:hypothetical protein
LLRIEAVKGCLTAAAGHTLKHVLDARVGGLFKIHFPGKIHYVLVLFFYSGYFTCNEKMLFSRREKSLNLKGGL